ncbi:hypothetical protein, partial [Porphyromonas uenonis]
PTTVTRLALTQRTHDRASLQPLHVSLYYNGRTTVRPYDRYSSRFDGDGRTTVRPYNRYSSRFDTTDALSLETPVHSYGFHRNALYLCTISLVLPCTPQTS